MSDHEADSEAKRKRRAEIPVFFQLSFRPFFLFTGIWATLVVPIWVLAFTGYMPLSIGPFSIAQDPLLWHQHEMLFGFAAAAVTGFILTAIPNWTGRLPVRGWRLGILAAAWIVGRLAMVSSQQIGPFATATLDVSLLTLLMFTIARELVRGKNWRNLPVLALISLLALANWLVHFESIGVADTAAIGIRLATFVLAVLVALIGGRILPSFTRNWLNAQGATSFPSPMGKFDQIALAAIVLVMATQVLWPDSTAAAAVALVAGILHGVRLTRWKTGSVLSEPIIWVMHLGYAWLVLGLVLIALSGFSDAVPRSAALHAITAGGFATMILAVMTRASLGHTGRPLEAGKGTVMIYVLITIAALVRTAAPFFDQGLEIAIWISGFAWCAGFGLFTVLYWPVLTRPRLTN